MVFFYPRGWWNLLDKSNIGCPRLLPYQMPCCVGVDLFSQMCVGLKFKKLCRTSLIRYQSSENILASTVYWISHHFRLIWYVLIPMVDETPWLFQILAVKGLVMCGLSCSVGVDRFVQTSVGVIFVRSFVVHHWSSVRHQRNIPALTVCGVSSTFC